MKKVLFSLVALAFCGGVVLAQETATEPKDHPMKHMMDKKGMMGMMAMKGGMGGREIVATTDGGVVVLIGNKLMKFDRDLNLKKETEIKIDREAMKKMLAECPMNCPMGEKKPEASPAAETPAPETAPVAPSTEAPAQQ